MTTIIEWDITRAVAGAVIVVIGLVALFFSLILGVPAPIPSVLWGALFGVMTTIGAVLVYQAYAG